MVVIFDFQGKGNQMCGRQLKSAARGSRKVQRGFSSDWIDFG